MPDPDRTYDLVVVGAGTGNAIINRDFDHWRVAIVEEGVFGGTCLNRGCIPSKMFVHTADIAETVRHAGAFGVDAHVDYVRWPDVRDRVFGRIDPLGPESVVNRQAEANVDVHTGKAEFVDEHTLAVDGVQIRGHRFVLAAGARPFVPPIEGLDEVPHHTSATIMRLDRLPEHLIIIGGGFVASEMAHIFRGLGSRVSIVARGDRLVQHEDGEVSARFTELYRNRMEVHLHSTVARVSAVDDGLRVEVVVEGEGVDLVGDTLLVATGRVPNADLLNVGAAGVTTDPLGFVITDEHLRTNVDHIWAIGDMTNRLQLKHFANAQLPAIRHNVLHPDAPVEVTPHHIPHAVFADPQVAAVGATEEELGAAGRSYLVGRRDYSGTAYGWALEDKSSFCKVLVDPDTRLLLGAHIIGPDASLLLQQLVLAMELEITVDDVARRQIFIHPALSEVVENALLDVGR